MSQHALIYHKLIQNYELEPAQQYFEASKMTLNMYKRLCKNIDCDFEKTPAITYSVRDSKKIEKEILALEKLGDTYQLLSEISEKGWHRNRQQIRERDCYLCQMCIRELYGTHRKYNYEGLQVHHAVPVNSSEELRLDGSNLITLSSMHHAMCDTSKIPYDEVKQVILEQEKLNAKKAFKLESNIFKYRCI